MGIFDLAKQLVRELQISPEAIAGKKNTDRQNEYYRTRVDSIRYYRPRGFEIYINDNSGGPFYLAYIMTECNRDLSLFILRANMISTLKSKQSSLGAKGIWSEIFEVPLSDGPMPNLYVILMDKKNVMKKELWPPFEWTYSES
jgi:hypothetical protein